MDPEFCRKVAIILINEVMPRARKLKVKLRDFPVPPYILYALCAAEYTGDWQRRQVREALDIACGLKR